MKKIFIAISLFIFSNLQADWTQWWNNKPFEVCSCSDRYWFDAEYLYWKIKNSPQPHIKVSEAPTAGGPGLTILSGPIKNHWRSGAKFTLGYWFDDFHCYGTEVSYFFLGTHKHKDTVSSDASPNSFFLRIPFISASNSRNALVILARPGLFSGTATLKLSNSMQGVEWNFLGTSYCNCGSSIVLLGGFRYWNFDEHLNFFTSSPFIPPFPEDVFETDDKFRTNNDFYAGQIGAKFYFTCERFFINLVGKIALGAMRQQLRIDGSFLTNDFNNFGEPEEFEGGIFAQPTNIGSKRKTKFAVLPEINVNVGYNLTDWLTFKIGYTFLYVNQVLWSGKQVDPTINISQVVAFQDNPADAVLVGPARPKAKIKSDSLWAQGLNVGFEIRF